MKGPRNISGLRSAKRAFRSTVAAGLLAVCVLSGAAAETDREGANKLIKEIIAGSRTSAEAAATLMWAAVSLDDAPGAQAMLCRKAYEQGVKTAVGQDEALQALDMLGRIEPQHADEWADKRVTLYRLMYARSKPAQRVAVGTRLVTLLRELADAGAAKDRWKTALKFYSAAMRTATALKLGDRAELAARIREVTTCLRQAERLEALKKKLLAKPDDDATRNRIIEICLLEYDSPAQAAEFVTEDGDEAMRTYIPLAAKDIKELAEPQCLELARWYRSLAKNTPAMARKTVTLSRAIAYFEWYLDLHAKPDADRNKASLELIEAITARRKLGGARLPEGAVLVVTFEKQTLSARGGRAYVLDGSRKRHRGLLTGGALVTGQAGRAMKFDGKTYVDFGNPKDLQLAGSQTVCMWLKPANLSARQNPINKAYGGEGTWTLEPNGGINYYFGSSGRNASPYSSYTMNSPLKPGQWAHVAAVRDLKTGKVTWYRDGKPVSSSTVKHRPAASKYPLLIGKGYVRSYHGLMDELAVFNRALSAKEIDAVYQMGKRGLTLK